MKIYHKCKTRSEILYIITIADDTTIIHIYIRCCDVSVVNAFIRHI